MEQVIAFLLFAPYGRVLLCMTLGAVFLGKTGIVLGFIIGAFAMTQHFY